MVLIRSTHWNFWLYAEIQDGWPDILAARGEP